MFLREMKSSADLAPTRSCRGAGANKIFNCHGMGLCGTCRVHVVTGDVNCASETLDPQDQEHGYVLACVTTVSSDWVRACFAPIVTSTSSRTVGRPRLVASSAIASRSSGRPGPGT